MMESFIKNGFNCYTLTIIAFTCDTVIRSVILSEAKNLIFFTGQQR